MKVIALLTGRGGNTLADKNVLPVLGKPLLSYPAAAAKLSGVVDDFFVSSDCSKILDAAYLEGYKKILRPKALATPTAKHIDVIEHALSYLSSEQVFPDILIVLMANSGTIKADWIAEAVNTLEKDKSLSSVVPVFNDQDHHPYRAKRLDVDGKLEPFFDFKDMDVSSNRQELEPCFFLCHNFWVMNLKNSFYSEGGQKPWTFLGANVKPIVVEESFDVHTLEDLKRTEKWLIRNKVAERK